jgi:hypothetical protein
MGMVWKLHSFPNHSGQAKPILAKVQELNREYEVGRLCSSSRTWQTIFDKKYAARFASTNSLERESLALLGTRVLGDCLPGVCYNRLEHFIVANKLVA